MPPKIVVITGPTATGKTRLGVLLCQRTGGEVVSADSMQVYQGMDIGTAKPDASEMCGVPHHLMGVVSPHDNFSVSRYVEMASACTDDIINRGKLPFIVGGTGLYIESLVLGRNFAEVSDGLEIRQRLDNEYDELGGERMLGILMDQDPETALKLHSNDRKRIIRALEVISLTGKTKSQHDKETKLVPKRYDALKIALTFEDRAELYARIDRRVDIMMEQGLENEVQTLLKSGIAPSCTAMQAIGYKELAAAISGKCSISEAVESIKQESRRYAKRQLSWLRRDPEIHWIFWKKEPDFEKGVQLSTSFMEEYGIISAWRRDYIPSVKKERKTDIMANGANLQDTFLNQARREKQFLTVFLTNGFQLKGKLLSFDSFTVVLETDGKQYFIYKHAISTIIPAKNVPLFGESFT